MSIFTRMQGLVRERYRPESFEEFYGRLVKARLEGPLRVPLLIRDGNAPSVIERPLAEVDLKKITALRIENHSQESLNLDVHARFSDQSIYQLFEEFVQVSHHSMRLNHARDFPSYYAPILAGARYFAFHGDGFCCFLALIFQGLVRSKLALPIDVRYSRNADHSFSHGYCKGVIEGRDIYIDPDLKAIFPYSEFDSFEPASWFYNFIENTAISSYHRLSEDVREQLFYGFTRNYFAWLAQQSNRELSAPSSRYGITRDLLKQNLPLHNERYDILADDYPWKARYRDEACRQGGGDAGHYLMYNVNEPVVIPIPAQGVFSVNEVPDELRSVLGELESIYYGRVVGTISWEMMPGSDFVCTYPEIPWGISIVGHSDDVTINGRSFTEKMTQCGDRKFLGMGNLDCLVDDVIALRKLVFRSSSRVSIAFHFPINASFWNSSLIDLKMMRNDDCRVYISNKT